MFLPVKAVEIDSESVAYLHENFPTLKDNIIGEDFLRMDLNQIFDGKQFVLTGNYPYDISSQIFFKMLDYKDLIPCCTGMIQREVALRMASEPGNKAYGILSVLIQAWYDVEYLFTVDEGVFNPPPKVKSAVIRMTRNEVTDLGCDEKLFKRLVKTVFNQRRKMLRVKLGIIAVSRDCFPIALSTQRRENIVKEYKGEIFNCQTTVENEKDMLKAVAEVKEQGCNALVVFLGNFGPETPETLIAKNFDGPVMFVAAAEGDGDMINGRGDAYCGMLNCSYNLGMRHLKGYIPEYPVGTAEEVAKMIADFVPVARVILGLKGLKIITFGPRPQDFFACNAPIKGLYELGVEIEENSELDLLVAYKEHANDPRIDEVCADMAKEMGEGCYYPDLSRRMAQFELTLLDWAEAHKGSRQYVAFADKCWPAFPSQFGFEPCYVNSRLVSRGIPVACEVDVYGALSEYIGMCASDDTVTLLDINNSVPQYIYDEDIKGKYDYKLTDTFMGFHCGNTPQCKMCSSRKIKYQLIQNRLLENGCKPDFTRGTLEGDIAASDITFYRLQCDSEGNLRSYIAEGEVLDVPTRSFGGIGIFAINEMGRFYRHVLIQKGYPHHGAVAFSHVGKTLFEVFKYLGIKDIAYNQPASLPYPTENPWK